MTKKTAKKSTPAADAARAIAPNNLQKFRERSRLTQEELSILTGLDPTTISKHENNQRGVDEEAIKRYARVFKCQSYELFVTPEVADTYDGNSWAVYVPGSPRGA